VKKGIKVTENFEITEPIFSNEMTMEEVMLLSAFGVLVFASFYAMTEKLRSKPKNDKFEFEVDTEMVPIPTAKENKKAIKQTLKNIMAKNNAKTTLIS
jgi:hypothetical protein